MRREFFILANVNETQRSSATLSGMNGRQKGKAQADGAGESGNSIMGKRWGVAPDPTRGAASGLRKGHCPLTLFSVPGLSASPGILGKVAFSPPP